MLFQNDIFILHKQKHRLLYVDSERNTAWTINIEDGQALPQSRIWSEIQRLHAWSPPASKLQVPVAGPAALKKRDEALERLGDLIRKTPEIFDPTARSRLLAERAAQVKCSRTSLYKDLRRYWAGGQTPSALLATYHRCGSTAGTGRRGRRSESGVQPYQLTAVDHKAFKRIIEKHYLRDGRVKLTQSYQRLLENSYLMVDGNGDSFIRPAGERPTFRQFEHFLYTRYSLEQRLRSRKGDDDFEREDRAKLGTVLADCLGVGHYYEADATIADVYLVASDEVRQIIGKATIYLIRDRKSRLIVGFYIGLENASWMCAMQAILSIAQDKAELCKRYGIEYHAEDWPAHQVFPKAFLADRGELYNKTSTQISDDLAITVANVRAKRPDWKAISESGFKLQRAVLEDGTPGFDPPENAKKRQGKHYEKDASLTLKQFTTTILNFIISYNRSPMRNYPLSLKELADGVVPSPINLWNHNIVERAGLLTRYDEESVRLALLPRAEATVTEEGILLNGCLYTCPEAITGGWFIRARRKRFKVLASYDRRLVDAIYVRADGRSPVHPCTLTQKSDKYRGFSVAETAALHKLEKALLASGEQDRIQERADMHRKNDAISDAARKKLKQAGKLPARTTRRADIKHARRDELRAERQETAASSPRRSTGSTAEVVALPFGSARAARPAPSEAKNHNNGTPLIAPEAVETPAAEHESSRTDGQNDASAAESTPALTLLQRAQAMRERMRNG